MKKGLIKKPTLALATSDIFHQHSGSGFEEVTASDLLIPRLALLQDLSPQVKQTNPKFIEGAEPGLICDVGIEEIFNQVHFLPATYSKVWLEWYPRKTQRGLAAIHPTNEILSQANLDDDGVLKLQNGNIIQETAQFFGFNLSAGERATFIPMASSQLKRARKWLTMAMNEKAENSKGLPYTPPLFYRTYILTSLVESKGEDEWFGWDVQRGPLLQELENWEELFERAVTLKDQISKGAVKGDVSSIADTGEVF